MTDGVGLFSASMKSVSHRCSNLDGDTTNKKISDAADHFYKENHQWIDDIFHQGVKASQSQQYTDMAQVLASWPNTANVSDFQVSAGAPSVCQNVMAEIDISSIDRNTYVSFGVGLAADMSFILGGVGGVGVSFGSGEVAGFYWGAKTLGVSFGISACLTLSIMTATPSSFGGDIVGTCVFESVDGLVGMLAIAFDSDSLAISFVALGIGVGANDGGEVISGTSGNF